jgi:hypothetical protein
MQNKPPTIGAWIFVGLIAVGVLWLWIFFFQSRPDNERDFATVTGTLASAEEPFSINVHTFQKTGHLEIRIREDEVRYCVPEDGYMDYFRRQAFFAEVQKGAVIQLSALASNIAAPQTFLLNSTPTVFVRGVRVGGRDYCTVKDHIAWQKLLSFIFNRITRRSEVLEHRPPA